MKALLSMQNGVAVYALQGDFDFLVRDAFLREMGDRVEKGQTRIVLNLRRVSYMTSSAIGALIAADKLLSGAGGRLVLSQLSEPVRASLKLVGLLNHLSVCTDDAGAAALCV